MKNLIKKILKEEFLKEAKNIGTLYHYTKDLSSLINILKTDMLKSSIHHKYYKHDIRYLTKSKSVKKNPVEPHVSFTRVKDYSRRTPFLLVIDGEKISNNYRIKPYSMSWEIDRMNRGPGFHSHHEFEERVYSDIKNVSKYITEIQVRFGRIWPLDYFSNDEELRTVIEQLIEVKNLTDKLKVFGIIKIRGNLISEKTINLIRQHFPDLELPVNWDSPLEREKGI